MPTGTEEALFTSDRRDLVHRRFDQSPRERQIDVEGTPADFLAELVSIMVTIEAPPERHGFSGGICSWIEATVCNVHGGRAPQVIQKARERIFEAVDPVLSSLIQMALDDELPPRNVVNRRDRVRSAE